MKTFDRFIAVVLFIILAVILVMNFIISGRKTDNTRLYKVEINRIEQEIAEGNEVNADSYDSIVGIYKYNTADDFYNSGNEYVIRNIGGTLYRIEYNNGIADNNTKDRVVLNIFSGIMFVFISAVLLYIRNNIIRPFMELSDYPYQLAKGTLSVPLKENRNRYFGRFIWGLNMLRETLENAETRELERAKKEKTFLMSLSHDIKTPLSAIKLYSRAVSKGMYTGDKEIEVMDNISLKADEIEGYVNEIIRNLNSDFMNFEINTTEFYLSQVIEKIRAYYTDKLCTVETDFSIKEYTDCLISGDPDRTEEVLQNIIENSIKYGDGHYISLSFSEEEDFRLITVTNSGCTLADSELPHIFDSFWRGSNAENRQGSGLGLYICHRLMSAMGGDIFAEISGGNMSVTIVCRKFS
ncbi:MAG: HAMP domain-containing histidine kinase [Ruminococcus flavefaciens]|nr:HAMP domain-containing histidine kinase [Ruminococcus flavefaciens]MCM1230823.1 HAMP domain-containing histidine kinase [Ruminococcus flavefaciens]